MGSYTNNMWEVYHPLRLFEVDELPSHITYQWIMYMLQYIFTILHRPRQMMVEVDLLL